MTTRTQTAANQFAALLSEINGGTVTTARIDALATDLKVLTVVELADLMVSLRVHGKPKSKAEGIRRVRSCLTQQLDHHVKTLCFA